MLFIDEYFKVMVLRDLEHQLTLKLNHQGLDKEFTLTLIYAKCDMHELNYWFHYIILGTSIILIG